MRARIVQQHIGYRPALFLGRLRLDARAGVGLVHPPLDDPRHSSFDVSRHHDDEREQRRQPGFHEQRDILHHHGVFVHRVEDLLTTASDQRVHDAV